MNRVLANLLLLGLLGVLSSLWLIRFTDWFVTFTGLVSLGGALSVLAALLKLVPEELLKGIQGGFEQRVLRSRLATGLIAGALVAAGGLATSFGALEITPASGAETVIRITEGGKLRREVRVGERTRIPHFTAWWQPTTLTVKALGYPAIPIVIRPFERKELRVPESFFRRVVLIRPSVACAEGLRNAPTSLVVQIADGQPLTREGYAGETVWLSADPELEVPPQLIDRWRTVFDAPEHLLQLWRAPIALNVPDSELLAGEKVTVTATGTLCESVTVTARPLGIPAQYVQEVVVSEAR